MIPYRVKLPSNQELNHFLSYQPDVDHLLQLHSAAQDLDQYVDFQLDLVKYFQPKVSA
jgi:hypothetical protein